MMITATAKTANFIITTDRGKALTAKGVVFQRYPGFAHDAPGIWIAPDSTNHVAWFLDLDGNNLSLTQH
jgi:hypothetical protein